eukprot:763514-Amphidinium_carterae.1
MSGTPKVPFCMLRIVLQAFLINIYNALVVHATTVLGGFAPEVPPLQDSRRSFLSHAAFSFCFPLPCVLQADDSPGSIGALNVRRGRVHGVEVASAAQSCSQL